MESFLTPYDLSNSGPEKLQFTPFVGGPKPGCADRLRLEIIKSHNFFCLRSYPSEFHIRTRLIKSFRTMWWCGKEKLHFTPVHTLRQMKRDKALIPPLRRVVAWPAFFRGRLRAFGKCTNGVAFSKGGPNLASVQLTLKKNSISHLFWCRSL